MTLTRRTPRRRDSIGSLGDMEYLASSRLWVPVGGTKAPGKGAIIQADGSLAWQTPSGGGASVPVADEGTPITAAMASLNFTGAGVAATDDGAGNVTVNVPNESSSTMRIWDPDKPPASPSANDVDFSGASALAAWPAAWSVAPNGDFQSTIFPATEPGQMTAQAAGAAWKGRYIALPAGNFNFAIRCGAFGASANFGLIGIAVGSTTTSMGSATWLATIAGYHASGSGYGVYEDYQNTQSFWGPNHAIQTGVSMWIRRVGTTLTTGWSPNGLRGVEATSHTPAWTPSFMFVCTFGSQNITQFIKWVRYTNASGARQLWGGARTVLCQ